MTEKEPITLTGVISAAMKIPGVRVDRDAFLREQFKAEDPVAANGIVAAGPVAAGCDRDKLRRKAEGVILGTTLKSTGASFLVGLPGGLAMAVTIPTDILQFYAMALKMAQEIAYLYGAEDLWKGGASEDGEATDRLILLLGVMLGVTGAAPAVRLMTSSLTQQTAKRLAPRPLTGNFHYPIVRSVLRFFAKTITKTSLAKGVSKAIPVIGGLVSGGITFVSLRPMGERLQQTLDRAHFSYSDADILNDIREVEEEAARVEAEDGAAEPEEIPEEAPAKSSPAIDYDGIRKAKALLDEGIIDEKEFAAIKARIISGK